MSMTQFRHFTILRGSSLHFYNTSTTVVVDTSMDAMPLVHPPLLPSVTGYLVCNAVLGFVSLVVLALRVWGRVLALGMGVDDWLILVAEVRSPLKCPEPDANLWAVTLISHSLFAVSSSRPYVRTLPMQDNISGFD